MRPCGLCSSHGAKTGFEPADSVFRTVFNAVELLGTYRCKRLYFAPFVAYHPAVHHGSIVRRSTHRGRVASSFSGLTLPCSPPDVWFHSPLMCSWDGRYLGFRCSSERDGATVVSVAARKYPVRLSTCVPSHDHIMFKEPYASHCSSCTLRQPAFFSQRRMILSLGYSPLLNTDRAVLRLCELMPSSFGVASFSIAL